MSDAVWRLRITGPGVDQVLALDRETVGIGSAPSNDLVLEGIAPKHCLIEGRAGKFFLRDLQSRQGVFVNGRKTVLHRLQPGDRVKLGPIECVVEAPGGAAHAPPPPVGAPASPAGSGRMQALAPGSPPGSGRLPAMPRAAPQAPAAESPFTSPATSPFASPAASPFASPAASPFAAPAASPFAAPAAGAAPPTRPPSARMPAAAAPPARPSSERMPAAARPPSERMPVMAPPAPAPRPAYAAAELPIHALLLEAREKKASDLHLVVDLPPLMRINGELVRVRSPLSAAAVQALVQQAMTEEQLERFNEKGDIDYCLTVGQDRYRANACQTRTGPSIAFRIIQDHVPGLADLKLPPEVQKLTTYAQGLVLVTGPLGSGKTTSIMALVDLINRTRHDHIITVEDPIEYLLPPVKCQVSQRELGAHTRTFETALRAALREDPDVIVIGDLRDYETARLAIAAAETGHLVFASMPAMNAMKTLDKLLDMFPAGEQAVVRTTVSESLRGVLSQRLVPGTKGELVVAIELLINSVAIANIIRDGKTSNLKSAMQTGKAQGMRTLAMSLEELVKRGEVTAATAEAVLAS